MYAKLYVYTYIDSVCNEEMIWGSLSCEAISDGKLKYKGKFLQVKENSELTKALYDGTEPLPEPMLTQIYAAIWVIWPQWVK